MKYTEKQEYAWRSVLTNNAYRNILFDGGARSGKTKVLIDYIFARAFQFPGAKQLVARKHRVRAKNSVWNDTIKKYISQHPEMKGRLFHVVDSELKIYFANGSEIQVVGLDNAERVERIRGTEYCTIYLNEATELTFQTMNEVVTRLSQRVYDSAGREAVPKLLLDCNPRGPRHWLYSVGVKQVDPETEEPLPGAHLWKRVHWSAYDNKENLSAETIEILENLPETQKQRMLYGKWVSSEGQVYADFDESVHVVKPFAIPADWTRVRAIDFGYTNPFVCLWGALDHDGRLYIYRELYERGVLTSVHAETIKRLSSGERYLTTVADHDAEERAELNKNGVPTEAARKNVQLGIQEVQKRLKERRIFFFPSCKRLLSEIDSYTWLPATEERNAKEEPRKLDDHAMDAMRYMVMAVGDEWEKSIKNKLRRCFK